MDTGSFLNRSPNKNLWTLVILADLTNPVFRRLDSGFRPHTPRYRHRVYIGRHIIIIQGQVEFLILWTLTCGSLLQFPVMTFGLWNWTRGDHYCQCHSAWQYYHDADWKDTYLYEHQRNFYRECIVLCPVELNKINYERWFKFRRNKKKNSSLMIRFTLYLQIKHLDRSSIW